jgi:peptidyl-Lys metalloendopeptidase
MKSYWREIATTALISSLGVTQAVAQEPLCRGVELDKANTALASAKDALDKAISAIDEPTDRSISELKSWFGIDLLSTDLSNASAALKVKEILTKARAFGGGVTFFCSVRSDAQLGDYYAYVLPDNSFAIVLGAFFWTAPDKGFSSKPGVIIHEMSHFYLVGASKDPKIYGTVEARNLAISNPSEARKSAENFEYFVEAVALSP